MPYFPKSKSDKWATPNELYEQLNNEFNFNCDPCPISWEEGDPDGLQIEWGTSCFVNPPYSQVAQWIEKAHQEWKKGKLVVLLINAIVSSRSFHKYIYNQAELRFIKGRIKFVNPILNPNCKSNPHASMVVIFR